MRYADLFSRSFSERDDSRLRAWRRLLQKWQNETGRAADAKPAGGLDAHESFGSGVGAVSLPSLAIAAAEPRSAAAQSLAPVAVDAKPCGDYVPLAVPKSDSPNAGAQGSAAVPAPLAASVAAAPEKSLLATGPASAAAPSSDQPSDLPQPKVAPSNCCGSCGYINCPTKLLSQSLGTPGQLAGQLTNPMSSGSAGSIASGGSGKIGASTSDPIPSRETVPLAGWNPQLPGGGETGTATPVRPIGRLTGPATTIVKPVPSKATPSRNGVGSVAGNAISIENQKLGNPESEWGIDGAGSSNIEGFATDISVNHGQTINFKINTNSTDYRIDIYRLGYYGGLGARKVGTIQHSGLQTQPAPLRNAATGAVDAGNWSVSASWDVPADAVSGVYIAKLVRQDGTAGENHIPFIVRDDSSHSDVVFQTADETWQAYNGWGGANLYGGNGPATGQGAGRSYAVSYNRPIATRGNVGTYAGPQDYLFGAEYAAISWMEQNGYDVSYMAGVDADRFGSLLLNHKAFVDAGHDEYWSGQQRTNVEAARDAGVNLMFWSGNEVYWKTRWGNSFSSDATAYRTMISYKETWAGDGIDPSSEWTGTFRDPRFGSAAGGGARPENSLTGTLFQVDDVGSNLESIAIPYEDASQRFWRNTSVANLQPGQTAKLTKNYLGYEWDEAPDNAFTPAGLVRLSSTTLPVGSYLLDYGNTTGNADATHSLTLYRAPSGALVFGAGTVYWSWGLSANHDNEATASDPRVQQAMVNLFADMGIQPATLQSGLIQGVRTTDTTAPTSTFTAPGTVTAGDLVTISGTASDVGGVIAGVEVSTDNGTSWHPAKGNGTWTYTFAPQVAGTYTVRSRAVDDSVNLETPAAGQSFTVKAPTYVTLFPGSATPAVVNTTDATSVELGVKFQSSVAGQITGIRFYKGNLDTGTHTGKLWSSTGTVMATLTFANETVSGWQTATFSSPVTITPGTIYTASYHSNTGHYSNTENYFTSNVTSGPLTAPAAGNGVFAYGTNSIFPTQTFQSTNFWVDLMFQPGGTGGTNRAPVAVADAADATEKGGIGNGSGGAAATGNVLANDTDPDAGDSKTVTAVGFGSTAGTLGTALAGARGSLVLNASGAFTYTVNETNAAVQALRLSTDTLTDTFSYTMRDSAGATASTTLTVTVHGANDSPVLAAQTGTQTAVVGSPFSLMLPAGTFTDVDGGDGLAYTATLADGSALPNWLSFDAGTRTFAGTPTSADLGTLGIKVAVADLGGLAASETFSLNVSNTAPPPSAVSLFAPSATPAQNGLNDGRQIELGMKFQSSTAGQITGLKFYRSSADTGADVLDLWTATGTKLASASFTNTTARGWQTVNLASPVTIAANTTYVASYHTTGGYVATSNGFASAVTNGPLTALSDAAAPGNGVYSYGGTATAGVFPRSTFGATNYFADVVFQPQSAV
ncbi:N,N-dimethylformamidase beta subunit family domain-containing protein [Aureimonas leprariae]|uniref:DUF4082 domain-containing protein n=1 Tax=Plantimonas leprariae TaxID=2615207 RepID=A0A7V7TWT5_9HYPH|nr:N,N-dimethylformamidase beta subunit family domain-containing protein [Aureimonas leprariae]KAB0680368.1 DUF4082 domain-containing protein [Aureimonas leprariae]